MCVVSKREIYPLPMLCSLILCSLSKARKKEKELCRIVNSQHKTLSNLYEIDRRCDFVNRMLSVVSNVLYDLHISSTSHICKNNYINALINMSSQTFEKEFGK